MCDKFLSFYIRFYKLRERNRFIDFWNIIMKRLFHCGLNNFFRSINFIHFSFRMIANNWRDFVNTNFGCASRLQSGCLQLCPLRFHHLDESLCCAPWLSWTAHIFWGCAQSLENWIYPWLRILCKSDKTLCSVIESSMPPSTSVNIRGNPRFWWLYNSLH